MVTKSKLKMALAAEKGIDFGKLHLKKREKAAKKKNATRGGAGKEETSKGKEVEEDWESVDESTDSLLGQDRLGEDDSASGSEDDADVPMKVCSKSLIRYVKANIYRLTLQRSMKVIVIRQPERMIKITKTWRTKTYPYLTSKIWTKKRKRT